MFMDTSPSINNLPTVWSVMGLWVNTHQAEAVAPFFVHLPLHLPYFFFFLQIYLF